MWSDITLVTRTILNMLGSVFSFYTTYSFLSALLIIWIVRRILKTFNII